MVGVRRARLRTMGPSVWGTGLAVLSIAAFSTSCTYRLQRRQWSLASEPTVAPYLKQRVAGAIAATSSDASPDEGPCMPPSLKRTDPSKGTPTCPAAFPAPSVSIATGQKKKQEARSWWLPPASGHPRTTPPQ